MLSFAPSVTEPRGGMPRSTTCYAGTRRWTTAGNKFMSDVAILRLTIINIINVMTIIIVMGLVIIVW